MPFKPCHSEHRLRHTAVGLPMRLLAAEAKNLGFGAPEAIRKQRFFASRAGHVSAYIIYRGGALRSE